jgi:hypothetical protein
VTRFFEAGIAWLDTDRSMDVSALEEKSWTPAFAGVTVFARVTILHPPRPQNVIPAKAGIQDW